MMHYFWDPLKREKTFLHKKIIQVRCNFVHVVYIVSYWITTVKEANLSHTHTLHDLLQK